MDKTINVAVRLERMHPKYGIRLRDTRKYMAHDEEQVARVGDLVRIEEGRKRSKNKAFELREVLRAAPRFDGSQFENTPFAAGRLVQPPGGAAKEQEAPDAVTPDMIAAATQRLKAGMLEAEKDCILAFLHVVLLLYFIFFSVLSYPLLLLGFFSQGADGTCGRARDIGKH